MPPIGTALSKTASDDSLPEPEVIEKMYIKVLESLMMPTATIHKLVASESIPKKWQMITMHGKQMADTNIQQLMQWGEKDNQTIELLKATNRHFKIPSFEMTQSLKLALRQPTKMWFDR